MMLESRAGEDHQAEPSITQGEIPYLEDPAARAAKSVQERPKRTAITRPIVVRPTNMRRRSARAYATMMSGGTSYTPKANRSPASNGPKYPGDDGMAIPSVATAPTNSAPVTPGDVMSKASMAAQYVEMTRPHIQTLSAIAVKLRRGSRRASSPLSRACMLITIRGANRPRRRALASPPTNRATDAGERIATSKAPHARTSAPVAIQPSRSAPRSTDRKSTRLNSSHTVISYAVFCLKKKKRRSDSSRCETQGQTTAATALERTPPRTERPQKQMP